VPKGVRVRVPVSALLNLARGFPYRRNGRVEGATTICPSGGMVDTQRLERCAARRGGSTPPVGTGTRVVVNPTR
jgi:hypothetical protein